LGEKKEEIKFIGKIGRFIFRKYLWLKSKYQTIQKS